MKDFGELLFYIENYNFQSKEDLKSKLEYVKNNNTDSMILNSIDVALNILNGLSEAELKQVKEKIEW